MISLDETDSQESTTPDPVTESRVSAWRLLEPPADKLPRVKQSPPNPPPPSVDRSDPNRTGPATVSDPPIETHERRAAPPPSCIDPPTEIADEATIEPLQRVFMILAFAPIAPEPVTVRSQPNLEANAMDNPEPPAMAPPTDSDRPMTAEPSTDVALPITQLLWIETPDRNSTCEEIVGVETLLPESRPYAETLDPLRANDEIDRELDIVDEPETDTVDPRNSARTDRTDPVRV